MSRKDYKLIAETIYPHAKESKALLESLALALQRDNPLFNADKFCQACGVSI